jgi:hypothetical protein
VIDAKPTIIVAEGGETGKYRVNRKEVSGLSDSLPVLAFGRMAGDEGFAIGTYFLSGTLWLVSGIQRQRESVGGDATVALTPTLSQCESETRVFFGVGPS